MKAYSSVAGALVRSMWQLQRTVKTRKTDTRIQMDRTVQLACPSQLDFTVLLSGCVMSKSVCPYSGGSRERKEHGIWSQTAQFHIPSSCNWIFSPVRQSQQLPPQMESIEQVGRLLAECIVHSRDPGPCSAVLRGNEGCRGKEAGPARPGLRCWVTGRLFELSVPQFSHLQSGVT